MYPNQGSRPAMLPLPIQEVEPNDRVRAEKLFPDTLHRNSPIRLARPSNNGGHSWIFFNLSQSSSDLHLVTQPVMPCRHTRDLDVKFHRPAIHRRWATLTDIELLLADHQGVYGSAWLRHHC